MFAIETNNLRKTFDENVAVRGLTLQVEQGEVFGFLGPNGAGKSTTIKMLLGVVAPTAGKAMLLGAPLGDRATRARIGFLPEHFRFHDWLTAREFLQLHGELYGMTGTLLKEKIGELLELVGLTPFRDKHLRTFSKGMLQRIGLAQALLNDPALVFLDEPTSGLDPVGRRLVRDIIHDLRERGTTIFLNSHLLSEVEVTCDRVAFVRRGSMVREVALAEQGNEIDVELKLGSIQPEVLRGLEQFGHNVRPQSSPLTGPLTSRVHMQVNSEARLPEMARWLVGQGIEIYHLGADRKSLEALFLEVMGEDERPG